MVPLLNAPPDRSRFTAGTSTVSPLSGPQRTRSLPRCAAERGDRHSSTTLLLSRFVISSFISLSLFPSPHLPPLSLPLSLISFLLVFKKNAPGVLMLPIKDSYNSDTVTNKQRSECHPGSRWNPLQSHINPRPVERILVSIRHPLAKHQVSGMLFWLEEAKRKTVDLTFLPLFFLSFVNFTTGRVKDPKCPCRLPAAT